jgi:hypothetical protein
MPYKLSDAAWLAREVERVKGALGARMVHGQAYTTEELLALLKDLGLDYSNPEYLPIGQKLLQDGYLQSVP